jgi:UDP-glucose 4-epimerase
MQVDDAQAMRVLVVGGNGFIGSHVIDALLTQRVRIVVFDQSPERFRSPVPGVEYIFGKINHNLSLQSALRQGFDSIIHLASITTPKSFNDNPLPDLENVAATCELLELCAEFDVKKFIFASSGGTVYGIPNILPIHENHLTNPICSYGIGKLAAEKYVHLYSRKYGLTHVILRIANPYGARQSPESCQGVIPVFMSRILQGKPLDFWGDGSVVRDFISVQDVAAMFLLALKSDHAGIFNVGTGIGTSVSQIVDVISTYLDIDPLIIRHPSRDCDVPSVVLDCQKAKDVYGWEPQIRLRDGIAGVASWLESIGLVSVAVQR